MMMASTSVEVKEEIAEVHTAARSPSPKRKGSETRRSRSGSRKLSNGHVSNAEQLDTPTTVEVKPETLSEKSKTKDTWIKSEQESLDVEIPIHDQIKMGILGFVEKEIKKSDKNPSFVFYSHDPNGLEEKFMKNLSRPSSGHKEKRSPSYRKKKRHSSRHRERELHDFDVPGSSLSALEKVDDYLKEYNKDEVVTLSGELEIEPNGTENSNGTSREMRHKPRKTRRKTREERTESDAVSKEVSPKVFKTGTRSKNGTKPVRPTDLTTMLERLESNVPYHDQYIDNPFSSPSPLTSPNDEKIDPFTRRTDKIYLQGGGTFRAVSRDRILQEQQSRDDEKYLRLGNITPLDMALTVQKAWRSCAPACHGVLGGLSLMHLLLISYSDSLDGGHLSFHAVVTMPYVATYSFFCVLCLLSVLDRLDVGSIDVSGGLQPWFQPIVLVILYTACLLVCTAARMYDELMVYQYAPVFVNGTGNVTVVTVPELYQTWTHLSVWRAVLALLGLAYFVAASPPDLLQRGLAQLLHYQHPLHTIG